MEIENMANEYCIQYNQPEVVQETFQEWKDRLLQNIPIRRNILTMNYIIIFGFAFILLPSYWQFISIPIRVTLHIVLLLLLLLLFQLSCNERSRNERIVSTIRNEFDENFLYYWVYEEEEWNRYINTSYIPPNRNSLTASIILAFFLVVIHFNFFQFCYKVLNYFF